MIADTKDRVTSSARAADLPGRLSRHILADGLDLVLDLRASQGSWLVDERSGRRYLDLYTFFASAPLGLNPPGLADDPGFLARLAEAAANKPANSDVYTAYYAGFVETFARVLGDPALPHLFFVEGGALAVENALKCAFDWKSRRNEMRGLPSSLGSRILHLTHAFHGRSGYTLSLTNSNPRVTDRFPKFDWPRIDTPVVRFPLAEHLGQVTAAENRALRQAAAAFRAHPDDIAAFIAEPIQGEGGDNHMRAQFLRSLQHLCRENDALFILDEVQTGVGTTGSAWAYQQLGLEPDVVAFGKRVQLGGIMAGRRVDHVPDNVFTVSGRISSTWGGGLADMVRSQRLLEIVERDDLFAHAANTGAWFLGRLQELSSRHPGLVSNARGRGLMCAIDLPDARTRDALVARLRAAGVLLVGCGQRSIRFRPALTIGPDDLAAGLSAIECCLRQVNVRDHGSTAKRKEPA
jgi:L-lysine 6-transaminase